MQEMQNKKKKKKKFNGEIACSFMGTLKIKIKAPIKLLLRL